MTEDQKRVLRELRHEGYAVIVWTPEELGEVSPKWVEDCSIGYGWEYLIDASSDEWETE